MTNKHSNMRWRKDRYGIYTLRHKGWQFAFLCQHGDTGEWFGHSTGSCLSADMLREIARKVDVLNGKETER